MTPRLKRFERRPSRGAAAPSAATVPFLLFLPVALLLLLLAFGAEAFAPPVVRLSTLGHGAVVGSPPFDSVPRPRSFPFPSTTTSSTSLGTTWSNGQAIREYQDFLATGKSDLDRTSDCPSVLVAPSDGTPSPVVDALGTMGNGDDVVVRPYDTLPIELNDGERSYPIYVCVRPTELERFLTTLPDEWTERRDDFVFVSGGTNCGCIERILKNRGYCRDAQTQVLVSGFTTPELGRGKPQDLSVRIGETAMGEGKYAGECAACGKWAGSFGERLERNDIRCNVGFYRDWRRHMWERASYDAIFGLVGAVREEPTSMQQVSLYYGEEVSDMLWEATTQLRGHLAVTLSYGFEERMFGFGEMRGQGEPCDLDPVMYPYVFPSPICDGKTMSQYLNYAQAEMGKLPGLALPRTSDAGRPSAMRQGNLRADGVL